MDFFYFNNPRFLAISIVRGFEGSGEAIEDGGETETSKR